MLIERVERSDADTIIKKLPKRWRQWGDWSRQILCCRKARPLPCVCAKSRRCPDHGEVHVGTHD